MSTEARPGLVSKPGHNDEPVAAEEKKIERENPSQCAFPSPPEREPDDAAYKALSIAAKSSLLPA